MDRRDERTPVPTVDEYELSLPPSLTTRAKPYHLTLQHPIFTRTRNCRGSLYGWPLNPPYEFRSPAWKKDTSSIPISVLKSSNLSSPTLTAMYLGLYSMRELCLVRRMADDLIDYVDAAMAMKA